MAITFGEPKQRSKNYLTRNDLKVIVKTQNEYIDAHRKRVIEYLAELEKEKYQLEMELYGGRERTANPQEIPFNIQGMGVEKLLKQRELSTIGKTIKKIREVISGW